MPTLSEVRAVHDLPLTELLFRAQTIHRQHHKSDEVQLCTLLSVKTGGCPEDCSYCPQSAHYETPISAEKSLEVEEVLGAASRAREDGHGAHLADTRERFGELRDVAVGNGEHDGRIIC